MYSTVWSYFMGKLIFLDIDGTLYVSGQGPSAVTIRALQATRSKGNKLFLSTARRVTNIPESVNGIGFDGGIYNAGGRAIVDGKVIFNRPISNQLVQQVIDIMREWNIYFMLEGANEIYIEATDYVSPYISNHFVHCWEELLHPVKCTQLSTIGSVYKIAFLAASKAQAEQLASALQGKVHVHCFRSFFINDPVVSGEITDRNIHKGDALSGICQYLGVDIKDCIAFGDSWNDAEILLAAGTGIAMGNAEEQIKKLADQVCERYDEDGIAKALTRMKLI